MSADSNLPLLHIIPESLKPTGASKMKVTAFLLDNRKNASLHCPALNNGHKHACLKRADHYAVHQMQTYPLQQHATIMTPCDLHCMLRH